MKKIIIFFCTLIMVLSCQKEEIFDIPRDGAGNAIITGVSSTTTTGITSLDNEFSVNAHVPNATAGDVMTVECLQLQLAPDGTTTQLLPLSGTQKQVTVSSDLKVSVSYTRQEANLNKPGDYVTVTFAGDTDYAVQRVNMVPATRTTRPQVAGVVVDIARTDETAYFHVTVEPLEEPYTGDLIAERKNGINEPWERIGEYSGDQPFLVPISGTDFIEGKDTMYYSFSSSVGAFTDVISESVIVREPFFYLRKTATLTLGGSSAGRNILINAPVAENDENAAIAVSESLILQGGSAWLAAGNTIQFVPTTLDMYEANSVTETITAFYDGVPADTANPIEGTGVFIYKAVYGPDPEDVYYGTLVATNVTPNSSVTFDYRIGNLYAHLAVIR